MKNSVLGAVGALFFAGTALAAPCDNANAGMTVLHYDTGVTALTGEQQATLDAFADTAKHRDSVCIFAQVDSQGSDDVNRRVSQARGDAVFDYLAAKGVREAAMEVRTQGKAVTLFGLVDDDSQNDRRVVLTYQ